MSQVGATFTTLNEAISRGDPSGRLARQLGAWNTVLQVNLRGEDHPFHVVATGGRLELRRGLHPKPVTEIEGEAAPFLAVAKGDLDITHLLARQQLRMVKGDYFDLLNLSKALIALKRGK